ncbi:MAG: ABC transporter ATP-binding protein [Actinomycetota bacterium]
MADAILSLDHVSRSFGSVRVIDDLSLQLQPNETLGVVGPNGAGKTTMMNLIVGTLAVNAGRILFDGSDITRLPPHHRTRAGIGRTHQVPLPFEHLTVFENVLVGARFGRANGDGDPLETAYRQVERVGLLGRADAPAGSLTLLERKRLELARALATAPRVLLIDEIAGGLTEPEVARVIETIGQLRSEGLAIVWIEHIVHAVLAVVDRLVAMDFGRKLAEGDPNEVMASPAVQAVYLGVEE